MLFLFGLFMGGIDNYAHAGGFVGGYVASIWLDPLKRERMDHLVIAAACLGATGLAIRGLADQDRSAAARRGIAAGPPVVRDRRVACEPASRQRSLTSSTGR